MPSELPLDGYQRNWTPEGIEKLRKTIQKNRPWEQSTGPRMSVVTEPTWTIVPSLRIETYREGVDDFEYAKILEDAIAAGETRGVDVTRAKAILKDIDRFFPSSVHWSQNDAWYADLRDRMARTIVEMKKKGL